MTPRDRFGHATLESPRSPRASGSVEKPAKGEPAGSAAYAELLADIRRRIAASRTRAAVAVNRELIELYWGIGREILRRQEERGWGAKVIDQLARDLKAEGHRGFSSRNLKYMRAFAQTWGEGPIVQQPVAQIPWGHNIVLLDKLKDRPFGSVSSPPGCSESSTSVPASSQWRWTRTNPARRLTLLAEAGEGLLAAAVRQTGGVEPSSSADDPQFVITVIPRRKRR